MTSAPSMSQCATGALGLSFLITALFSIGSCRNAAQVVSHHVDASSQRVPIRACCAVLDAETFIALKDRYERTPAADRPPEVAFLAIWSSNGLIERTRAVIKDSSQWASLWHTLVKEQAPLPPLPRVDFAREMLIVVGAGARPSGGFTIMIDSVVASSGKLTAFVRENGPGPGCGAGLGLSTPAGLARLPRFDVPMEYSESRVRRACS